MPERLTLRPTTSPALTAAPTVAQAATNDGAVGDDDTFFDLSQPGLWIVFAVAVLLFVAAGAVVAKQRLSGDAGAAESIDFNGDFNDKLSGAKRSQSFVYDRSTVAANDEFTSPLPGTHYYPGAGLTGKVQQQQQMFGVAICNCPFSVSFGNHAGWLIRCSLILLYALWLLKAKVSDPAVKSSATNGMFLPSSNAEKSTAADATTTVAWGNTPGQLDDQRSPAAGDEITLRIPVSGFKELKLKLYQNGRSIYVAGFQPTIARQQCPNLKWGMEVGRDCGLLVLVC